MSDDWRVDVAKALGLNTKPSTNFWSKQEQEQNYAIAYEKYQKGNYTDATKIYTTLVYCNPFSVRFWKGLAASQQMLQKFEEALQAWSLVAILSPKEAQPHLHAAECFLGLSQTEEAQKAFLVAKSHIENGDDALQPRFKKIEEALTYG
jgi:type III secretion system low calcium response chaperone LcrH/SycD